MDIADTSRRWHLQTALTSLVLLGLAAGAFLGVRAWAFSHGAVPGTVSDHSWTLTEATSQSGDVLSLPVNPLVLRFEQAGRQFQMFDTCNMFGGPATTNGNEISFSTESSDLMGCGDDALLRLIDDAFDSSDVRFAVSDNRLVLSWKSAVLTFRSASAGSSTP